jgi:hypothetical protein
VMMLAQHLESCKFSDFWMLATSCKELIHGVPGGGAGAAVLAVQLSCGELRWLQYS